MFVSSHHDSISCCADSADEAQPQEVQDEREEGEPGMLTLDALPIDVLRLVFAYLSPYQQASLARMCTRCVEGDFALLKHRRTYR